MFNQLLATLLLLLGSTHTANMQIESVKLDGDLVTLQAIVENPNAAVRVVTVGFYDQKVIITQTVVLQPGQKRSITVSRNAKGVTDTVGIGYFVQGECRWIRFKEYPVER